MFTGLHPLRHKVLSNGHKLSRGYQTIAEVLQGEGYSTGAFVSSFAVDSEVGLDQGFSVYDDDFTPYISGFTRINLVRKLVTAWMVLGEPARTPWLFERDGETTVSQFKKWLPAQSGDPFFAWVHLFEPHAPYDALEGGIDHRLRMGDNFTDQEREQLRGQYLDEVRRVDGYIGQIIETLDSRELSDNTLVILVADHGEMLGEHGYMFNHFSLYDEVVRVPMIVVAPGLHFKKTTVDTQVRLMDLPATILDYLQIDAMEETEGVELIGYAEGHRKATMWCSLIGREGRSGDLLVGLRNNGVKYIRTLSGGAEQLFNVEEDSVESSNIVDEQAATLEQARRLVSSEARALEVLSREAKPTALDARSMLKALGYTQ
jgi:choline-sulfatase